MKIVKTLLLSLVALFCLYACGSNSSQNEKASQNTSIEKTPQKISAQPKQATKQFTPKQYAKYEALKEQSMIREQQLLDFITS